MKINLDSLKYLEEYLKENDLLEDITDFKQYIINTIIDNVEFDFGIDFYDYVDMNNFVEYDERRDTGIYE